MKFKPWGGQVPSGWGVKFFLLFAFLSLHAAADDFRVGVVDIERILRESEPAVKAERKIEKEFWKEARNLVNI